MLTVTRDDQTFGRRHGTVYIRLIFGFAICWIPSPWGVLDVKGVLVSSCVVVTARGPWMLPILVVYCSLEVVFALYVMRDVALPYGLA